MSQNNRVFDYLDYRRYLTKKIAMNASTYGYKAKLAEAAGCQRSFFSQVLNGSTDLLLDHAVGLSEFWQHSSQEQDYFINLVSYARAGTKKLKDHFKKKIDQAIADQENLSKRIVEKAVLPEASAAVFYSQWYYLAFNILLTIPKFRTVSEIQKRLNLAPELIGKVLEQLEGLGCVVKNGTQWLPTNSTIHIPRDSQFNSLNHAHWRTKAIEDSYLNKPSTVHYTSVCSVSLEDANRLKQLTLDLVDNSRKIIGPSKEEDLYCLTVDWFRV